MHSAAYPTHVDAIEQHGQLGGVHLNRTTIIGDARRAKAAFLQALVIENEAAAIPKQDFAAVASSPQKHEQMPGEQVHSPLPTDYAAQAIMAAPKIDWLDREIDPNARRQREQRLPQPANHRRHVRGIAPFLETKPKPRAELELNLLRNGARQAHRQQRERLALHRCRAGRLVQVVLQGSVAHAMLGRHCDARNGALLRLGYDRRPKFSAVCR